MDSYGRGGGGGGRGNALAHRRVVCDILPLEGRCALIESLIRDLVESQMRGGGAGKVDAHRRLRRDMLPVYY